MRGRADFSRPINVICPVQPWSQKYSVFCFTQNTSIFLAVSSPKRGRIAIVTNAGWDAVDATVLGARTARRRTAPDADGKAVWS